MNNINNSPEKRFRLAKVKAMKHIDFLVDATMHSKYIEFIGCRGDNVLTLQVYNSGLVLCT